MNGSTLKDPLAQYLDELGRHPMLSAPQEVALAQAIETGRAAQTRISELEEALASDERDEFLRQIEAGQAARRRFIEANLRLAVSIARRYAGVNGVSLADLVQEANLGLIRAVDKFDHRRGFKFSTYATWWIRQAVTRAIADKSRTIRLPVQMGETVKRVRRAQAELSEQLRRSPTVEEIAQAAGIPAHKALEVLAVPGDPASLDQVVGIDEATLGDFIRDPGRDPFGHAAETLRREGLWAMLGLLSERERRIVALRFGLADDQPQTLVEVGQGIGLTRERIRQIEAEALDKLRQPSVSGTQLGMIDID